MEWWCVVLEYYAERLALMNCMQAITCVNTAAAKKPTPQGMGF